METQDKVKLRRRIASTERTAHFGAAAVLFGLSMEVVLAYLLKEQRAWWKEWLPIVADALVALGVLAELYFGRKATEAREALQLDAEESLAVANALAQQANLEAAKARERAAKIERRTAWRHVSVELHASLIKAIQSTAASWVVKIEHQSGDSEAHCYANEIGRALSEAGVRKLSLSPNAYPFQSVYGLLAASAADIDMSSIFATFRGARNADRPVRDRLGAVTPTRRRRGPEFVPLRRHETLAILIGGGSGQR